MASGRGLGPQTKHSQPPGSRRAPRPAPGPASQQEVQVLGGGEGPPSHPRLHTAWGLPLLTVQRGHTAQNLRTPRQSSHTQGRWEPGPSHGTAQLMGVLGAAEGQRATHGLSGRSRSRDLPDPHPEARPLRLPRNLTGPSGTPSRSTEVTAVNRNPLDSLPSLPQDLLKRQDRPHITDPADRRWPSSSPQPPGPQVSHQPPPGCGWHRSVGPCALASTRVPLQPQGAGAYEGPFPQTSLPRPRPHPPPPASSSPQALRPSHLQPKMGVQSPSA